MSEEELAAVLGGEVVEPNFSAAEAATHNLALNCAQRIGRDGESHFVALRDVTDQETAVGVLLVCSRYLAHANFVNTLAIGVPSNA